MLRSVRDSRLSSIDEFEKIIVKTTDSGSVLYLKDVARVELGAESYNHLNYTNGHLSAALSIQLAPRSNAIAVSEQMQTVLKNAQANLPAHYQLRMTMDRTPFITSSIEQVAKTLVEAMVLVVLVMFIFLQNLARYYYSCSHDSDCSFSHICGAVCIGNELKQFYLVCPDFGDWSVG